MNIAVYHKDKRYGGIENQIFNLIHELTNDNHIIFITDSIGGILSSRLESLGINVYIVKGGIIRKGYQIANICKKNCVKVLTAHTFDSSFDIRVAKIFRPKLKTIFRVHTYIACSWISPLKKKIYYAIDGINSFLINNYIVNGQYLKNEVAKSTIIPKRKVESVIDGIEQVSAYRQLTHITTTDGEVRILMVANVIPHKGHDTLIHGLAILRDKGFKVKCDILGDINRDKNHYNYLLSLSKELNVKDRIKFLGFADNKIITDFPIVVLPSDSEGTPNCIMEAMSVGRIVSVSATGGVPEMIQDSKDGFLHLPQNAESFANSIERIINMSEDEIARISSNAYKSWKHKFSSKVMSESIYKIMQRQ